MNSLVITTYTYCVWDISKPKHIQDSEMFFLIDAFQQFRLLTFWCSMILSVLIHTTSASQHSLKVDKTNSSQSIDRLTITKKLACPLWFYYVPSTNSCQCLPYDKLLNCDGSNGYVRSRLLVTVDLQQNQSLVSVSKLKSNLFDHAIETKPGFRLLPENISELNDYMCGPLNRKGYLCSDCIDGFGPSMSIIEHPNHCYECRDNYRGVMLYLAIVLLPLTLLYLLILIFQIRMTSAPIPCFVLYSQLIVIVFSNTWGRSFDELATVIFTKTGNTRAVTKVILVLYGIFDLDFISHTVPPFCVSKDLRLYHRVFLGYITAFHPMMLILITWICIELHDHNFRMIVFLWRPFHKCFVRLRRGWDTKNDLIDVFATFFLLSFVKIMYQTVLVTNTSMLDTFSLSGEYLYYSYVSGVDNSIPTASAKYIIAVISALVICIIFNLLPILLLVLYPFGTFRRMLSKLRLDRISLTIFTEKFHCCYRDGLDGTRDMRYFSGLYFFLVISLFSFPSLLTHIFNFDHWFIEGTILLLAALLIVLCRPYKKMYMNVCDTFLLSHLAIICFMFSQKKIRYFIPFMQVLFLLPFAVLVFVVCFRLFCKARRSLFIKSLHLTHYLPHCCLKAETDDSSHNYKEPKVFRSLQSYGAIG